MDVFIDFMNTGGHAEKTYDSADGRYNLNGSKNRLQNAMLDGGHIFKIDQYNFTDAFPAGSFDGIFQ